MCEQGFNKRSRASKKRFVEENKHTQSLPVALMPLCALLRRHTALANASSTPLVRWQLEVTQHSFCCHATDVPTSNSQYPFFRVMLLSVLLFTHAPIARRGALQTIGAHSQLKYTYPSVCVAPRASAPVSCS